MSYLCYHHNDMDGKGAANEVYKYWTSKGIQCTPSMFIQRGYDEPFSEQDYENNTVYIVDLSFTKESIKKLFAICEGAARVAWIDHHESSVKCIEDDDIREKLNSYDNLNYFVNQNACGALLTHLIATGSMKLVRDKSLEYEIEYIGNHGNNLRITDDEANSTTVIIPQTLKFIDLWDRWVYGDYMNPVYFQYGCGLHFTALFAYENKDATEKTYNEFWKSINSSTFVNRLISEGQIAKKYADEQSKRNLGARGYECDILGHKALVLNMEGSSMVFGNKIKDYDLVCLWQYNGKTGLYTYSLYSDNKVNCAEIATKLNPEGGGHPGAAGFSSKELLFKK